MSGYYNISPAIQVSGAFRARTGLPVNANAAGLDLNGDGVLGDRTRKWTRFRPRAGHKLARPPLDLVGAARPGAQGQLYAERYNVLNHENVRTVLNDYGPTPSAAKNRWLEPNSGSLHAKCKLGLRLSF